MTGRRKPWTPGPWAIARHCDTLIEAESGRNVASAGGYQSNVDPDRVLTENKANARLIAASTQLVELVESYRVDSLLKSAKADPLTDLDREADILLAKVYGDQPGSNQTLERQPSTELDQRDYSLINTIRDMANRYLPQGEVGMTERMLPWAYCLALIGIIERIASESGENNV